MPVIPESLQKLTSGAKDPNHIPDPQNRKSVEEILEELQHEEWYRGQIVHKQFTAMKEAAIGN